MKILSKPGWWIFNVVHCQFVGSHSGSLDDRHFLEVDYFLVSYFELLVHVDLVHHCQWLQQDLSRSDRRDLSGKKKRFRQKSFIIVLMLKPGLMAWLGFWVGTCCSAMFCFTVFLSHPFTIPILSILFEFKLKIYGEFRILQPIWWRAKLQLNFLQFRRFLNGFWGEYFGEKVEGDFEFKILFKVSASCRVNF